MNKTTKDYGDERVASIQCPNLSNLLGDLGFPKTHTAHQLPQGFIQDTGMLTPRIAELLDFPLRNDAEFDVWSKQVIPYIVFVRWNHRTSAWDLLAYVRGDKGGENRLHGQLAFGFGGHINPIDGVSGADIFIETVQREIKEELNFTIYNEDGTPVPEVFRVDCLGYINDDSTTVGKSHLGQLIVVTLWPEADPSFRSESGVITQLGFLELNRFSAVKWLPAEDYAGTPETLHYLHTGLTGYPLESWSKIAVPVLREWLGQVTIEANLTAARQGVPAPQVGTVGTGAEPWSAPLDGSLVVSELRAELLTRDNLLETAWGIIANASGGNWERESRDWQDAATAWRDKFFGGITGHSTTPSEKQAQASLTATAARLGVPWAVEIVNDPSQRPPADADPTATADPNAPGENTHVLASGRDAEDVWTVADVKERAKQVLTRVGPQPLHKLLTTYGAVNVSGVDPTRYHDFMCDLAKLLPRSETTPG